MITIHRTGLNCSLTDHDFSLLHQNFQQKHFVYLPNLVDSSLLEEFHSKIIISDWENRIHDGIGAEVCLKDPGIVALLNFLMNDQDLFRMIQRITGCAPIGCFQGRVYKMIPNSGHYDSWHTDFGEDRLLALSLNLGKHPYEGGILQIEKNRTSDFPVEAPNIDFGQAVLFNLSGELKHRVTNVEGNIAKTAFAGWFKSTPDLWASLTELSQ